MEGNREDAKPQGISKLLIIKWRSGFDSGSRNPPKKIRQHSGTLRAKLARTVLADVPGQQAPGHPID
jgi:hypothetical protein